MRLERDSSAVFRVPCLPAASPAAPTPPELKLQLHEHQGRALHRCLLIERDGALPKSFNLLGDGWGEYASRGGVLADSVGMGKTAVAISLILSSDGSDGPTLVVAPGHLIEQWRAEIAKFTDALPVIVGLAAYSSTPPSQLRKGRHVVLIDVKEVTSGAKLWYDFRRVFKCNVGKQRVHLPSERMDELRKAGQFCVQSPRGPCSYVGWVYTDVLHCPSTPWRRVIFDEIQDLVADGSDSQKNLLQLSRTAHRKRHARARPSPARTLRVCVIPRRARSSRRSPHRRCMAALGDALPSRQRLDLRQPRAARLPPPETRRRKVHL